MQAIAEAILENPSFSIYNNEDFLRHAASVPSTGPLTPADPTVEISRRVLPRFMNDDPNQMPDTYAELFLLIRAIYEDRLDRGLESFMFPPFIPLPDLRGICTEQTELLGAEY